MATMIRELPKAMGFMGSDRFFELNEETRNQLNFSPVAETAIRFAMATTPSKSDGVNEKIVNTRPMVIATTYPRRTLEAISGMWETSAAEAAEYVETIYFGGSLESKPKQIERVDAIIDVVDSGATLAANDLLVVRDRLGEVELGAVWRNDA